MLEDHSTTREKARRERSKSRRKRSGHQEVSSDSEYEKGSDDACEDMNSPYKRPKSTPFTQRITRFKYHKRAKLPQNIGVYKGNKDLEDQLGGAAQNWFDDLDPKSVDSFEELSQKFLEEFSQQKRYTKDTTEIHGIKRRQKEGLQAFMDQFKYESSHIKGVPQILCIFAFMHGHAHPELAKKLNEKNTQNGGQKNGNRGRNDVKVVNMIRQEGNSKRSFKERRPRCQHPVKTQKMQDSDDGFFRGNTSSPRSNRSSSNFRKGRKKKDGANEVCNNEMLFAVQHHNRKDQNEKPRSSGPTSDSMSLERTWGRENAEEAFTISHELPYQYMTMGTTLTTNFKQLLADVLQENRKRVVKRKFRFHTEEGVYCFTHMPKELKKLRCYASEDDGKGEQVEETPNANKGGIFGLSKGFQANSTPTTRASRLYLGRETIKEGSGIGIILISPEEKMYSYAIRFKFKASNHAVDCEALLAGLAASANQGMKDLHVFTDSITLIAQVPNHTSPKNLEPKSRSVERAGNYKARIPQPGSIDSKDRPPMLAPDKEVPISEGSFVTTTERYKETYKNVSQDIRDQLNVEAEAAQIIFTGIDNDIYSTVDAYPNTCEMWKAIERLKQGESINVQDLKTILYWEFGKFTSHDGESLESYYSRFYKIMNELIRNQCDVTNHQVNVQFLLQLQPEWQRFVTLVKQNQELKTVSYHKLYDILKQNQNEVNEIKAERIARTANPLILVAQQQPVYHPQNHPTHYNQNSSTRSQQAATRNRGKAIVNSPTLIYDQESSMVAEDDEMSKDKEIDKIMALISLLGAGYDNQRLGNVAGDRETVGTMVVQKSRIQCYNCKEFRHVTRECQKPKRAKDANYHRENMLLCKQEEAGIQLNAEQADWRDDTNDELEDQELEAHYMYMAQLQEVSPDAADSGPIFDTEPVQKVSNHDHYNVFAIESEHPEQFESIHNTYPIEQDEHNMIIDSLDMSYDKEKIEQNDDDNDIANEHELLASLLRN
uniref:Reverse transcriptase domain-containing protein n=1 Tax=Tanacetum cinerariifolium TaxID=118510 RepID=A0A6L2L2X5_TANCI|nr:reverse transcriptase domain-containing protein [Tanacetum cinerariifolium]